MWISLRDRTLYFFREAQAAARGFLRKLREWPEKIKRADKRPVPDKVSARFIAVCPTR